MAFSRSFMQGGEEEPPATFHRETYGKVTSFSKVKIWPLFSRIWGGGKRGGFGVSGGQVSAVEDASRGGVLLGTVGPQARLQRARHCPKTPSCDKSQVRETPPPGGAWWGRLSGRALSSKPFPLGGSWLHAGPLRKRGAALPISVRWSPNGEQESRHFWR